jgi:hypothetical protein
MNCARIHNVSMAKHNSHILNNARAFPNEYQLCYEGGAFNGWQSGSEIRAEDVLNGFFLYSLLLDKSERGAVLVLHHNAKSQSARLETALADRNKLMEGIGQECWPHACNLCCKIVENGDGTYGMFFISYYFLFLRQSPAAKIQAAVADGDTIGHQCCGVHDCVIPLSSSRDRYCPNYKSKDSECAVTDCFNTRRTKFQTCEIGDHQALESTYYHEGKSIMQLRARAEQAGVYTPTDSLQPSMTEGPFNPEDQECEGKSDAGNRKLKAHFGRCWTHNEQLMM